MATPLEKNSLVGLRWPYAAIVPHSVKTYPVVQTLPNVRAMDAQEWPKALSPKLERWRDDNGKHGRRQNQLYVHIPFCPFLCHFCPLYKVRDGKLRTADAKAAFVDYLLKEIAMYGSSGRVTDEFTSVYFGGGTPTQLTTDQLAAILNALKANFRLPADAEITLEGVARDMLATGYLERCLEAGFNRISFGVQSLDPELRKSIGRGDKTEEYIELIRLAKSIDPDLPVNLDLLVGLPGQSVQGALSDIATCADWDIGSMDVLYFVMTPDTKLKRFVEDGRQASPIAGEALLELRMRTIDLLIGKGFTQATGEVFIKQDKNNFVSSAFGGSDDSINTVLALGPSAFGTLGGWSYQNTPDLVGYEKLLDEGRFPTLRAKQIMPADARRRSLIFGVLKLRIPASVVSDRFSKALIAKWLRLGLVTRVAERYELTLHGKYWYNLMQFEALSWRDRSECMRLIGSADEWERVFRDRAASDTLNGQLYRLLTHDDFLSEIRGNAFRHVMRLRKAPVFQSSAIGFTGDPVAIDSKDRA